MDLRSLPNLTVHQLAYVIEAAAGPTWTDAAARLGVSQPALSQGIAEVERRLGAQLFERRPHHRDPTPALAALLPVASRIVAAVDDLDRHLAELATGARGELRIGMIDTAALGRLAAPLRRYRESHPDVRTTLDVDASEALAAKLDNGALDVCVMVASSEETTRSSLTAETLFSEPMYVYAPDARAARMEPRHWGPWVTYPSDSRSRHLIEIALVSLGAPTQVVAESSNPDVLRQMVRLGVGWTVLPRDVAEQPDSDEGTDRIGLARVPGGPLVAREIVLATRNGALPNGALDGFVAAIRAAVAVRLPTGPKR